MNVAVIGAAGFLGSFLMRAIARQGHSVIGYGRHLPDSRILGAEFRIMDVVGDVSIEPGIDAVIYLAQSAHYRSFPQGASDLFAVNALGVVRCAEAAAKAGVKKFFHASTGNVCMPSFDALSETAPEDRTRPYSLSKLMGEEALQLFSDLETCSFRLFGLFGPGQKDMLSPNLIDSVRNEKSIRLFPAPNREEDGGLKLSFTFVEDAALAITQLLEVSDLPSVLNIADPQAVSLRTFSETIGRVIGKEPVFEVASSPRPFDLIADTTLMQTILDTPFTPLGEALAQTVAP